MESMKLNFFAVVVVMLMAVSAVTNVTAQIAPAPPPSSDAVAFVPTAAIASVIALSVGFLF
ncbi:arabinogalactan protein 14-like [Cynara cardunculus var. scolymus]|uniref:arabinogalactan protein 14-like n=1 Tax=Cynara cardunculus var. scolymus TaxID=59895 RepID=UPI000D62BCAE|nr:arabinogalactan protein 14-like [Cynara cardunculus var. scolymus]